MKLSFRLLAAGAFGVGASLFAQPSAAAPSADAAWQAAYQTIMNGPGDMKGKSRPEQLQMMENRTEKIRQAHLAFYENYPNDVRRWDAALVLQTYVPQFYQGFTAEGQPIIDTARAAAWKVQQQEMLAAMGRALPTLPARLQEKYEVRPIFAEIGTLYTRMEHREPIDWAALRKKIDAHAAKFAGEPGIAAVISRYLAMFERDHDAQTTLAEWHALTANPLVRESNVIKPRLTVIEREMAKPMEMAFTAADGRPVDLAQLRGKVVLIDFWATWCGPCIAELPNVKRVYDAYHAKGFEVIGISLEDAHLLPTDSAAETAAKHAAAKKKLLDFTTGREIPWPQHYDGKYWNNEIARGRFNVNSVPATFLIDKQGMIAAVGARGPQLETEVKRLLAQ